MLHKHNRRKRIEVVSKNIFLFIFIFQLMKLMSGPYSLDEAKRGGQRQGVGEIVASLNTIIY